ncbi:MAG TPA: lamin tail domain-containing protein [Candidatus Bacteroides intestinavium]|uniref:Lamin tail domain-containing protein n=1 Tax=Candidatus Bacteroides intestinavium TaxID=2838469 RepID=A0A9D2HTM0_9BACE|nr:lamin tail domain-containing protein [Candidatus Bacteroides intestinavium]
MKKVNIGIFCSLLLALGFTSCTSEGESKLMLNEVLVDNRTNFQDDYGVHSAWIEIFNKSYGSADLAGCYLKHSSQPGDTAVYFIPKGDVLTKIKPRQHALFWADDKPNRGTFHTNFLLETDKDNWIGLYDSGKKKLDEIVIPAGLLQADQSYARVDDAAAEWEVKDESAEKYVTPNTNNKTLDKNVKMEKFEQHDSIGIGMAITAMTVVFIGLILLYIFFKFIGKASVRLRTDRAMKAKGITDREEAKEKMLGHAPGEVYAAIAMAMHEMQSDVHDVEETVLTITRVKRSYSPWSSKIYTLRETPQHTPHKR